MTVTIKYGTGYDEPWAVFHGRPDEIQEDLTAYFGIPSDAVQGLTLSEIVVNATAMAHGLSAVVSGLGATVVASQPQASTSPPTAAAAPDAWEQASTSPAPEQPAADPILASIQNAQDIQSLQRVWAENRDAFTEPAVMEAWKARGRALSRA
jgi:hypothetical protein